MFAQGMYAESVQNDTIKLMESEIIMKFKLNLGIEDIQELIDCINQKPFEEKLTLASFDG